MSGTVNKEKWYKGFNNYKLSIILTFLASLGVAAAGIFFHSLPDTFVDSLNSASGWIIDVAEAVYGFFFVSRMVSGIGYVATPVDIAFNEKNVFESIFEQENTLKHKQALFQRLKASIKSLRENIQKKPFEFIGLIIGFLAGISISIASGLVGVTLDPLFLMKGIGIVFTYVASISTFSGLFSRLGRSFDFYTKQWSDKLKSKWVNQENVNYVLSVTAGIVLGVVLAGIVGGLGLLPGGQFVAAIGLIGIVSTCASSSGYIGRLFDAGGILHAWGGLKIVDFFRTQKTEDLSNTRQIKAAKKSESRGTAIGVSLGVTLGIVLIVAGVATLPFFGLGLPKLLAGIIIMGTCISVSGGLGNRIGNSIDKKRQIKEAEVKQVVSKSESVVPLTPERAPLPSQDIVSAPAPTSMPSLYPSLEGFGSDDNNLTQAEVRSVPSSLPSLDDPSPRKELSFGKNSHTLWQKPNHKGPESYDTVKQAREGLNFSTA